jgi:Skp family chaperone for outer membrane proteins
MDWRQAAAATFGAALLLASGGTDTAAQTDFATGTPVANPSDVLTVDQARLFRDSRYGQKIIADIQAELSALEAENRRLESALETEEQQLTGRRATLPAEEFRALADAFDAKVRDIRAARDAKEREVLVRRDAAQKTFLETAIPILAGMMTELGAVAILDRSAIILSFGPIDITDRAIERIDATLDPADAVPPPAPTDTPSPTQPTEPADPVPPTRESAP